MLRILHAADLHLDSPFASLPPEQAADRRAQQRQLPKALAALCKKYTCDLMLLAGDVFDGSRVCPETIDALQEAFAQCPIPIFIAPGNHDPFTSRSPWATAHWPENVHIFDGPMTCTELPQLRCRIWGAGFREAEAEHLLRPIPRSHDGFLEIGLLHGDPLYPGPYNHIEARDIETSGLDYLALGHIHRQQLPQQLGRTWYGWPGAAMGRGFDETGPKGVFCVALDRGLCETKFIPLPVPRYEVLTMDANAISLPPDSVQTICRLVLTGEADRVDTFSIRRQYADWFQWLEIVDKTTPRRDLWAACGDGTLRGLTMDALRSQYDEASEENRPAIVLAARYALAALEGREAP